MSIKSYLVFPHQGKMKALQNDLERLHWCEVIPAENEQLFVIVAETTTKDDEAQFLQTINKLRSLEHMTLVSGFDENQYLK
jgi:nitrate reductase NapAB chaperone NapD